MKTPVFTLVCLMSVFVACSSPQQEIPKRPIPMPIASIDAKTVCPPPKTPFSIESVVATADCLSLLQYNENNQIVMIDNAFEETLISTSNRIVQPNDWRNGERPARYASLKFPTAYQSWLLKGLRQLEDTGVLLQSASVLVKKDGWQNFVIGNSAWPRNIEAGQSVASRLENTPLLQFSAGFNSKACSLPATVGEFLGVAPYSFKTLVFSAEFSKLEDNQKPSILKTWIDAEGEGRSQFLPLKHVGECWQLEDSDFDATESSAYAVVIKNTLISSPIWYAPLKG